MSRRIYENSFYDYDRGGYHNFGGRHSIDDVSGRPIYVEDYILPTFEGSTLIVEFEFPFTLTNDHVVSVISENVSLTSASVTRLDEKSVSIRWEASTISNLSASSVKTLRIRVENTVTGIVKVYNELTIKLY